MDGVDETAAATWPPIWSLIRGYLSPATLFLLVNLVIGTIALTSRSHRRHRPHPVAGDLSAEARHPQEAGQQQLQQAPPPPAPLARTSSVLECLRTLGLYRFRSGDIPPEYSAALAPAPEEAVEEEKRKQQYGRSRSEAAARRAAEEKEEEEEEAGRMRKSRSEAKRPARVAEERGVDERADDFISKFRQQLQLQRLNSLLDYKEMLNRRK